MLVVSSLTDVPVWAWDRQPLGRARTMTRMSALTMCTPQGTIVAAGQKGRGEKCGMRFGDEEGEGRTLDSTIMDIEIPRDSTNTLKLSCVFGKISECKVSIQNKT